MKPGRVPRGVTLLCCSEIHLPPPLAARQRRAPLPAAESATDDAPAQDDSDEEAVAQIWMPPRAAPAPGPVRAAYVGGEAAAAADPLSAWLCPETSARIQRERARRRRALQIAEQMSALAQTEREQQQRANGDADGVQTRRGRKRQLSDTPPPSSPARKPAPVPDSPELQRPQSLLIPELLPKGMLRTRPAAHADIAPAAGAPALLASDASASDAPRTLIPQTLQTAPGGSAPSLGLGLDLGFDIARPASAGIRRHGRHPSGGTADCAAAIMEIADFLEKDIDVFTPMAVARTPRSAAFPVPVLLPPPPLSTGAAELPRIDKQQELIDDILNMSFARRSP
ncbi:hypothetical protein IWQ56_002027 [Coemansia nantahalensis]|nr:hypothetical protein IWQ56_002027 [Coemansia nantahalensis]